MNNLIEKSEKLDIDLTKYVRKDYKRRRVINILLVVIILLNIATLGVILQVAHSTNRAVKSQIPGLQSTIKARDKTIRQQTDVINQEIEAIKKLAAQVVSLGGDPGLITISPKEK